MDSGKESILSVQGLNVSLGRRNVLKDISFQIETGDALFVLGPNGVGKSSLLKALVGAVNFSGSCFVDGLERTAYSQKEFARKVAYVPQSMGDIPPFTVSEFLELSLYPYRGFASFSTREAATNINFALEATDTVHLRDRIVSSLSGGEHQRILIASALAQRAPLMLLDEPTAHLDPAQKSELFALLNDLRRNHSLSILVVTHELGQIEHLSSKVLALKNGEVCFFGSPQDFLCPELLQEVYGVPFGIDRVGVRCYIQALRA
ncbi:MAG: ABC transporter ATP-binding protein, partial [Bdellovibrionales bacterium]|nr:ABC transporter ATP-binding protein [Bdellovibrionales bacterium]